MGGMSGTDWLDWHAPYDDADSSLSQRLAAVQRQIRAALDEHPDRPVRVVSACAGQGRDLLEVLATHPARDRVTARLVELDPRNARIARAAAAANGLTGVEVVQADAGAVDSYAGAVPADLVLFCGVFGNISNPDIERTVRALPQFCAPGATVVWTRGRWETGVTAAIRRWFDESGFTEKAFEAPDDARWSVGADVLTADPAPPVPGERLFTFVR
jgi:putative methyltransferase